MCGYLSHLCQANTADSFGTGTVQSTWWMMWTVFLLFCILVELSPICCLLLKKAHTGVNRNIPISLWTIFHYLIHICIEIYMLDAKGLRHCTSTLEVRITKNRCLIIFIRNSHITLIYALIYWTVSTTTNLMDHFDQC